MLNAMLANAMGAELTKCSDQPAGSAFATPTWPSIGLPASFRTATKAVSEDASP
jgi:hypothetical protein